MFDLITKEELMFFPSAKLAKEWLRLNINPRADQKHLMEVCKNKGNSSYGFGWKYK